MGGPGLTSFAGTSLRNRIRDDTNGLITFAILPLFNSPQGIQFFSKENLDGGLFPTLQLTFTPSTVVPIPAALPLLLSGLLGLAAIGWRRRRTG